MGAFRQKRFHILLNSGQASLLGNNKEQIETLLRRTLKQHAELAARSDPSICKKSPETTVSLVRLEQSPTVCVKEYHWRGFPHAVKSWFRPSHGLRTFLNGLRLHEEGINVAKPLALIQEAFFGLPLREWVVMEVVPKALELDRYILKRKEEGYSLSQKREILRNIGEFIGLLHRKGIHHTDLKTCNILISESVDSVDAPETSQDSTGDGPTSLHRTIKIVPIDYDDVTFSQTISERKRVKNLVQLFLSTPLFITMSDRVRFLNAYCSAAGLSGIDRRRICQKVMNKTLGQTILYVSHRGDVVETRTPTVRSAR